MHILSLWFIEGRTGVREDWQEKGVWVSLPFHSVPSFSAQDCGSYREMAGVRGYDRIPWLFVFLRKTLPCFRMHSNFWFKWKAWLLGAVSTHSPAHSVVFVTHLFELVLLNSYASRSIEAHEALANAIIWMGLQGMVWLHMLNGIASAHMCAHFPIRPHSQTQFQS